MIMHHMHNNFCHVLKMYEIASKVGCVFPMVIIPTVYFPKVLPQAEFGPNDHREDAPHFRNLPV